MKVVTQSPCRSFARHAIVVGAALLVSLTACAEGSVSDPVDSSNSTARTMYTHSNSVIDRSNPAAVAGFATDIFFADVTESLGSTTRRGVLETQYRAQVTEVLKGSTSGTIVINQAGGIKEDVSYVEKGDALLVPGQSYMIAARYSEAENWYTAVPVSGDVPVTSPSNRAQQKVAGGRAVEDRGEVRKEMQNAIANAIPFSHP
ncbi:hypothetical protein GCM10023353_38300 [Tomitella cavernea]|uniref:Uncharacterized protein n=1 Tax=Tomitella cavernea TaxID=1387982 RepID=A0ABP9D5X1_9ACTN